MPALRWWRALNPAIYLISILPAIAVNLLAGERPVWQTGLIASTLAVVLLQHAINLLNDVSDWRLGADTEKMDSWVRIHQGDTKPVTVHALGSFVLGGMIGLSVLIISGQLWILSIALPLIGLGYLYNAGTTPLSYNWTGEWVTAICYGPGVFGCLWLVAGLDIDLTAVLGMSAFAALATSLLLSHQPPQIETDRRVGKKSFAVRYGKRTTCRAAVFLFAAALLLVGTGIAVEHDIPVFRYVVLSSIIPICLYPAKTGPNPKKILLLSSAFIALSLAVLMSANAMKATWLA
ncbi:MAG: prenyltransferase [Gammaproteobacteria bacterium]